MTKKTEYAGRWDGKPPEDGFYYVYNTDRSAGALRWESSSPIHTMASEN